MRLVEFEDPVWGTIQGEGILVGTPSVFIRTYGCDFSCSWCDTKGSWKPGSKYVEWPMHEILGQARSFHLTHAVVTGGNPLLQAADLAELIVGLQEEWIDLENDRSRAGMHVTVETQGSVYDEAIARHVDLISLSPKLHDWRDETLKQFLHASLLRKKEAQVKIVCGMGRSDEAILRVLDLYQWATKITPVEELPRLLHFILQPESGLGRKGVEDVRLGLEQWREDTMAGFTYPVIRLIPQCHKSALYVR